MDQWRLCSGLYNLCPARADTGDTAGLGWERSLELSKFYIDIGGPYSQYLDMASTRAFTLRIFFYEMAIKAQSLHLKLALFPTKEPSTSNVNKGIFMYINVKIGEN